MREGPDKPVVLVVDDEPEWQDMLRAMLQRMGAGVLLAGTLEQACEMAAEHAPGTQSPLALLIIDMGLPHRGEDVELDEEAGIHVLRTIHALQTYRLVDCPMLVFTAFPSYENCAKAVKGGALAYISKRKDEDGTHGGSGGFEELKEWCERLLVTKEPLEAPIGPGDEWFERNYAWLSEDYAGQWVALATRDVVGQTLAGASERDGVVIVSGESYEAVRDIVIKVPALLRQTPAVLFIPKASPLP
jgi:CheY-like chemotaxis protein